MSQCWCNRLPIPAVGVAELGIGQCPRHSSVRLTISESQQIVDGGLSSVCLGRDNCQLASSQYPMFLSLASRCSVKAVRSPRGQEATLAAPFSSERLYRLLIRPSSTLAQQIIGLQGKTGVTTSSCQLKEAQLCILAQNTLLQNLNHTLIWDGFQD